ncbi:MAG: hypothetical protein EPN47_17670 [Acidobacteria bacterium]|jgi:hypothetical protein|nr:MAG: hypothetical protein EPN47_17670 [Acidobacteriota bacterium]
MAGEINGLRLIPEAAGESSGNCAAEMARRGSSTENARHGFNRYLYENLLCHVESQIESWNRRAVREPNPEAGHALWLKAEGLGYALRLLYAFEPEFRELVECAKRAATGGVIQR